MKCFNFVELNLTMLYLQAQGSWARSKSRFKLQILLNWINLSKTLVILKEQFDMEMERNQYSSNFKLKVSTCQRVAIPYQWLSFCENDVSSVYKL